MHIAVACVKWGTKYASHYVNRLRNMVARHLSVRHDFICFTDDPSGIDAGIIARPLPEGMNGWWNKLALFRPGAFEPGRRVIYFDLDIVVTGPIDFLAACEADLTIIQNAKNRSNFNSSVMVFGAGRCSDIYERFAADPESAMRAFMGDQEFIRDCRPDAAGFPPGKVLSFKRELDSNAWSWLTLKWARLYWPAPSWLTTPFPAGASVVIFHGLPNPSDVIDKPFGPYKKAPWIAEHWR